MRQFLVPPEIVAHVDSGARHDQQCHHEKQLTCHWLFLVYAFYFWMLRLSTHHPCYSLCNRKTDISRLEVVFMLCFTSNILYVRCDRTVLVCG
jgi:hypothetical protein